MTDEEKKAIEKIKKILYMFPESKELKLLLNLIEKQSKEIEELKEDSCCMTNCVRRDKEKLFLEDKIKEFPTTITKEKNKEMSCDLTETRADNIDESTMLKQIKLKLQEKNIPIETLLAEFERLEDLEDDLTTVYLNGVYDGEKKVEDKIKAKIEKMNTNIVNAEKFDCDYIGKCRFAKYVLQSLLEKE